MFFRLKLTNLTLTCSEKVFAAKCQSLITNAFLFRVIKCFELFIDLKFREI